MCPAIMEILPELWLVDAAGQVFRPARPTTACGLSKPGVGEALGRLSVEETVTHKVRLIEPRAALDAGCPNRWKAPLPGETGLEVAPGMSGNDGGGTGSGQSVPGSPGLLPEPADVDSMRVCQYGLDEPETVDPEPVPGGDCGLSGQALSVSATFASGHTLNQEDAHRMLNVARSIPDAKKCEAVAPSFAVLWPLEAGEESGTPITVELEGCQRLIPADGKGRQVPPELLAAVAGDGKAEVSR